jgi:hypothetical protein
LQPLPLLLLLVLLLLLLNKRVETERFVFVLQKRGPEDATTKMAAEGSRKKWGKILVAKYVLPSEGFEPSTFRLKAERSTD